MPPQETEQDGPSVDQEGCDDDINPIELRDGSRFLGDDVGWYDFGSVGGREGYEERRGAHDGIREGGEDQRVGS